MTQTLSPDEVMEAYWKLSEDDREDLFEAMKKRRSELNQTRILAAAEKIREEHAQGLSRVMTAEEIVREIYS